MRYALIPLTAALALACAAPFALARDAAPTIAAPAASSATPAAAAPSASPAADTQRPAAPAETRQASPARRVIDINTASEQELMTLHGIGEARARAIVEGRPYDRKDDLVRRKVIPQGVYDRIRERLVAKRGH